MNTKINLKLFAQGAYTGSGEMASKQSATVKLHGENEVLETFETTLAADGTLSVEAETEGSVYLSVRTQNTLEVFTPAPIALAGGVVGYDFTTAANQAYGSNQTEVESGVFAIFSGDIDGTGTIDELDYDAWQEKYLEFAEGGTADLNSDGLVDLSDFSIYEGNIGKEVIEPTAAERIGLPNPRL
jgi:hypothetical protein